MLVRASELRLKDVVNTADGRRLGNVYDLDMDLETGRIKALILPAPGRSFWIFGREQDLEIPWDRIVKIGVDVILVDLPGLTEPWAIPGRSR